MAELTVTSLYAALLTILGLLLAFHIAWGRHLKHDQKANAPDDIEIQRRSRAFGNFSEYTPWFLLLLALLEIQNWPMLGAILGLNFLIGRICHAYGLLIAEPQKNDRRWRGGGMLLTFFPLGFAALMLVIIAF